MSVAPRRASPGWWLAIAASLVVTATVVCAIVVMGSPTEQRKASLDANRARELANLSRVIDSYAMLHGVLPASLAVLDGYGQWLDVTDPEDGSQYTYAIVGDRVYRLCAVFATTTSRTAGDIGDAINADWPHRAGRQCFDRRAPLAGRR